MITQIERYRLALIGSQIVILIQAYKLKNFELIPIPVAIVALILVMSFWRNE